MLIGPVGMPGTVISRLGTTGVSIVKQMESPIALRTLIRNKYSTPSLSRVIV